MVNDHCTLGHVSIPNSPRISPKTSVFYQRFQALFSLAMLMMTRLDTAAEETWVSGQFSLYRGSSRNLTSSHTTRDAFMNWSFAFSRDVSLDRQCFYQLLRETSAKIQIHGRNMREPNHFPLFHSVKGGRFAKRFHLGLIKPITSRPNKKQFSKKKNFHKTSDHLSQIRKIPWRHACESKNIIWRR